MTSVGALAYLLLGATSCTVGSSPQTSAVQSSGFVGGSGPTGRFVLEWPCASGRYADTYRSGQNRKQDEYCEWVDGQTGSDSKPVCEFHSNFNPKLLSDASTASPLYLWGGGHNGANTLGAAVGITSDCYENPTSESIFGDEGRNSDPNICAQVRAWQRDGLTYAFTNAATLGNAPSRTALAGAGDAALSLPVIQLGLQTSLPAGCSYVADGSYPDKTVVRCTNIPTGSSCMKIAKGISVGISFEISRATPAAAPAATASLALDDDTQPDDQQPTLDRPLTVLTDGDD